MKTAYLISRNLLIGLIIEQLVIWFLFGVTIDLSEMNATQILLQLIYIVYLISSISEEVSLKPIQFRKFRANKEDNYYYPKQTE